MNITVIDNYDSFVYNICDYIGRLKRARISVYRNNAVSVDRILDEGPNGIVISPGPGNPNEAGISIDLIKNTPSNIPVLGVCLGHQALAAAFGGTIKKAERILHGKTSMIYHNGEEIFLNLDNPFSATRYHSLIVEDKNIPAELEITAKTESEEIMGIRHKKLPFYGVQFHPESILTENGLRLIENFINIVSERCSS